MTVKTPISMVVALLAVLAFTAAPALAAAPETPKTEPVTPIAGTSATFNGELLPGSSPVEKVTYFFDYSPAPFTTCNESGMRTAEPFSEAEDNEKVFVPVTGLEGSTTYVACLVASNPEGETVGSQQSFTTLASRPVVESQSDSGVTPFAAILEGQVNPENQETTYHLEYATEAAKLGTEEATTLAYGIVGPGISAVQPVGLVRFNQNHEPEPEPVSGLSPNTTYYYRVVAKNATGEVKGTEAEPVGSFKTLVAEEPSVTGERLIAASFSQGTDTIEAQIDPEYQGFSCEVQYVTKEAFEKEATKFTENVRAAGCSPVPPATEFGQGSSLEPFTATLGGLRENTAYEYRVVASNGTGTFDGLEQPLARTPPRLTGATEVPEVTRELAQITPAAIVPEVQAPLEAGYYVAYGTNTVGEHASADIPIGSGLTPNIVSPVVLSNLVPGTTYRYAVVTYNGNATQTGPEQTFTTMPATPPTLSSITISNLTETTATIIATLEPNELPTRYELQLGATPGQLQPAGSGNASGATELSLPVGSLTPGTVYYYKLTATNADGSNEPEGSFTTAPGAGGSTNQSAPAAAPALIPYQTIAELNAREAKEAKGIPTPIITKTLTKAEKLKQALKACHAKKGKKRSRCEAAAHKKYGPSKKKKAKK